MRKKWEKLLAREGVDIATISEIDIVFYELIREFVKVDEELLFTYCHHKAIFHCLAANQEQLGRRIYKKYFRNSQQIEDYYRKGKLLLKEIKSLSDYWKKKIREDNLIQAYKEFRKQFAIVCRIYSIISWFAIEFWQKDFERALNKMISSNNLEEKRQDIMLSVYQPWKETALIKIQKRILKGEDKVGLVKKYQFLRSWCLVWYRPIDEKWFKDLGGDSKKKKFSAVYNKRQLFNLLKPNKEEKLFLELAPYMVFFKDWRDDLRRQHAFCWSFLFDKIAETWKVARNDIGFLTLDEIENGLTQKLNVLDIIKRRRSNPVVITVDFGKKLRAVAIDDELKLKKYRQIINNINKEKLGQDVIKGTVAQKGKVKGRVKVIFSYHDIKHIEERDILVANSTHPNYLPAMKRAAAFVTNEGGMISHAAIVAREMKKPCIVGTKVATQVLKSGDLVEVDAERGIVRRIK